MNGMETKTVGWFSAGVSSFVAIYLMRHEIDEVIYIDIADQHPDTHRFLKDCEEALGKPIKYLKHNKYNSVKDVIEHFKFINSPYGARCTAELKKKVRLDWEKEQDCLFRYVWGYDAKETKRAERVLNTMLEYEHVFPLIDKGLSKEEVHGVLQSLGIKRPVMYDLGYSNNNCFTGDTEIVTADGLVRLDKLVDKEILVKDRFGEWKEAVGTYTGVQEVVELSLSVDKVDYLIKTTGNHRWAMRESGSAKTTKQKTTSELSVGNVIELTKTVIDYPVDKDAQLDGFIYGDGSYANRMGNSVIAHFCGEKKELMDYFGITREHHYIKGKDKKLPEINKDNHGYLYNWLIGYFAADGCVSDQITLSSSKREDIEYIRNIAETLGIPTILKDEKTRDTNFKKDAKLSILKLRGYALDETFFLRTKHKERFNSTNKRNVKFAHVKSIKFTGVEDHTFCVRQKENETITLAGQIGTYQCVGCVKGGMGYWNKIRVDFPEVFKERAESERKIGASCIKGVFLDELDPNRGRMEKEIMPDCGMLCEISYLED